MKKLTSILLTLVLLISALSTVTSAEVKTMTRNEAAELVRTLLPPYTESSEIYDLQNHFYDTKTEHTAIHTLKNLGVLKGDGDMKVRPDDEILFEEAVVMFVRILGYEDLAIARADYPMGYIMMANNMGLTKGIAAATGIANAEDIKKMYENALDIPKRFVTEYDAITKTAVRQVNKEITYRKDLENYKYKAPTEGNPKVTVSKSDNLHSNFISPPFGISFSNRIALDATQNAITVEMYEVTNPLSNYYVSVWKVEGGVAPAYPLKHFGPFSLEKFTISGLESGNEYDVTIYSSINSEGVTGRIYAH